MIVNPACGHQQRFVIPDILVHYGFDGLPVHMRCPGFTDHLGSGVTRIEWKRCQNCGVAWASIAIREIHHTDDHHSMNVDSRIGSWGEVSISTGDLIINNFDDNDQGLYKCEFTGWKGARVNLANAGTFVIATYYKML